MPPGITWSVILNGTEKHSSTNNITFSEPSGRYSYSVKPVSGYNVMPSNGSVTVNYTNIAVEISFMQVKYAVTFTESGLPSGTVWYINLSNGESFLASTPTITFNEPNGTYSYTITAANKTYIASPGYFTVNGEPVAKSVAFTIPERAPSSSSMELYEIIGAVMAAVVIFAAVALMRRKR